MSVQIMLALSAKPMTIQGLERTAELVWGASAAADADDPPGDFSRRRVDLSRRAARRHQRPPPAPGRLIPGGVAIRPRCYGWITDSGGRGAVMGSACLWTTLHAPSSRRKTVVTLTATRTFSSAPPTRAR